MSHSSRRHARMATIGSILFLGGFAVGGIVGVGKLHRALTNKQPVQRMSCREMVRNGVEQSPMVMLTDAVVHVPAETTPEDMESTASPMLQRVRAVMAHPKAKPVSDRLVRGHVTPTGALNSRSAPRLNLGYGRSTSQQAEQESVHSGELLVHASRDSTAKWLVAAMTWLDLDVPQQLTDSAAVPCFVLHPATTIDSVPVAATWVIGGVVAMAFGMVLCGSASLGWWALLCPIGALIGLPGMPFRAGRGGRVTRWLAVVLGLILVSAAYFFAIERGGLLTTPSSWWMHLVGLLMAALGLAAWIGVFTHGRACRRSRLTLDDWKEASRQRGSGRQVNQDGLASPPEALAKSIKPSHSFCRRYLDPRLSVSPKTEPDASIVSHTVALEKLDFEEPLLIEVIRHLGACDVTAQVGCRNLVLALTDRFEGVVRLRMISILEDGHVVVTIDDQDEALPESRAHDSATVTVVSGKSIDGLLSKHLKLAAEIGESSSTTLVPLESAEWRDIIHYSERCIADVLHQVGDEKWDIADSTYGRFTFPPQAVAVPSVC